MRRAAPAALACVLAFLAAACGGGGEDRALPLEPIERSPSSAIVVPAGEPIVVGTSSALTGPVGQRGTEYGVAAILGVNRWKSVHGDLIEGHEIAVQAEDDGCTEPDITVGAAERLLRRPGLVGVLGPQCSAGASAAIPVYARAGVIAISGSATTSDLTLDQPESGFFFRTAYTNRFEGELNGAFVAQLGADSVQLVHDSEAYGIDLVTAAAAALSDRAVEVTVSGITRGQVDFGALAARIARANPDFVGFAGFNPEAALFYRQLRDAGYKGPFGAGDAAASLRDFVGPVGTELAEGVYFGGCSLELTDEFVDEFRELFGSEPTAAFVAQYADAAGILLSAVDRVARRQPDGSLTIDPGALRSAVRSTDVEDGFSGHIAFDLDGDRTTEEGALEERARDLGLAVCQVRKGQLAVIFPE